MTMSNYLTQDDEMNYGRELVDFSQRAALHALGPTLQQLQQQNADLQQQVAHDRRRVLDEKVARLVPDYRTIDRDPAWHRWLLEVDMLSGRPRQQLLDEAKASGNARQVEAIFNGFRNHGQSAGGDRAPRGRSSTSGKPFYTRDQITRLYEQHRRGAFGGGRVESDRGRYLRGPARGSHRAKVLCDQVIRLPFAESA
jgi:hypothetical protein